MILPKGGKRHQKIGRLFVTGMMLTGGSALFMAQIKPNPFLFIIGVFTIYLVGTADRYLPFISPILDIVSVGYFNLTKQICFRGKKLFGMDFGLRMILFSCF